MWWVGGVGVEVGGGGVQVDDQETIQFGTTVSVIGREPTHCRGGVQAGGQETVPRRG